MPTPELKEANAYNQIKNVLRVARRRIRSNHIDVHIKKQEDSNNADHQFPNQ